MPRASDQIGPVLRNIGQGNQDRYQLLQRLREEIAHALRIERAITRGLMEGGRRNQLIRNSMRSRVSESRDKFGMTELQITDAPTTKSNDYSPNSSPWSRQLPATRMRASTKRRIMRRVSATTGDVPNCREPLMGKTPHPSESMEQFMEPLVEWDEAVVLEPAVRVKWASESRSLCCLRCSRQPFRLKCKKGWELV